MCENDPGSEPQLRKMRDWIGQNHLLEEAETPEAVCLKSSIGGLTEKQIRDMSWLLESTSILGWSLRAVPLQEYDDTAYEDEVLEGLGYLQDDNVFTRQGSLRPPDELEDLRASYEFLLWRLRDYDSNRKRRGDLMLDANPLKIQFRDGDVLFREAFLTQLDEPTIRELFSIVQERYQAITWVVDKYPHYYETPLDT